MARQPRFVVPGQLHLLRQRGHDGEPVVRDGEDRRRWLDALRDTASTHRVVVHGWCLDDDEFRLLARPPDGMALSRMLQDLGRRYVAAFNLRHGRRGTLWDGRFRCAAIQPGPRELVALAFVEHRGTHDAASSSAPHHLGLRLDPWLDDPPAYWALGNTPFDRQHAWRSRLEQGLGAAETASVERALRSGIPLADPAWLRELQPLTRLRLFPRPRGRPRRAATNGAG